MRIHAKVFYEKLSLRSATLFCTYLCRKNPTARCSLLTNFHPKTRERQKNVSRIAPFYARNGKIVFGSRAQRQRRRDKVPKAFCPLRQTKKSRYFEESGGSKTDIYGKFCPIFEVRSPYRQQPAKVSSPSEKTFFKM